MVCNKLFDSFVSKGSDGNFDVSNRWFPKMLFFGLKFLLSGFSQLIQEDITLIFFCPTEYVVVKMSGKVCGVK